MKPTKAKILKFIDAVCKNEKIDKFNVKFTNVAKGGAMVHYYSKQKELESMSLDIDRITDLTFAILHELAHVILIRNSGDGGHGAKFKKIFNYLNDKYMYSEYESILYK